jgi:ankyrin repeat protein
MARPRSSTPADPRLEQYRKQAKELLKAYRARDPQARARLDGLPPRTPGAPALHDAQRIIAREQGFPSWAKLKRHVESLPREAASPEELFDEVCRAARAGDTPRVDELLRRHPPLAARINEPLFHFDSPAIVAAKDNLALVDVLLAHGADINARSAWWAGGFGVLDYTEPEVAKALIERGAVVDVHAAAWLGMLDRLRELVRRDPELVHAPGGDGQRPLHFASTPEVVDFLLAHGAEIDARDVDHASTAAQYAVPPAPPRERRPLFHQDGRKCRYLIERGATVDIFMAAALGDSALARACLDRDPGCVTARVGREGYAPVPPAPGEPIYLYNLGIHVSPHDVAAAFGHREVYELLVERSPARERLLAACWQGDEAAVRRLLAEQPDLARTLPPQDMRLIADAAWDHNTKAVRLMLDAGFDPHARGSHASTPLDRAAFHGFVDIIRLLLERDPAPPLDWKNEFGSTPLSCCIYGSVHSWRGDGDHAASVEALIAAGSPVPEKASGSEAVRQVLRRHGAGD